MELFRLLGTIAIDNAGAIKEINKTADTAEQAEGKMGKSFDGIGKAAAKMAKIGAAAVSGIAVGIGAITKQAVSSYADYEQLVGGVETLFKDSQDKVLEYANNAYKTAGLSANEYMETVTSFSASLLQSLDGDTDAAAEKADKAITDMSDNANKMGTSMESIQNAYQGFAKQNYTMLDNLKLGYGGTKEEMERLLADATALSGVEYDIQSYADIVDAIHVVQDNLGITGTTAKEASTTIQGSLSAMKASWANLLTGMSDSSQDFGALLDNFVDSAIVAANNLIPRLLETVPRVVQGLSQSLRSLMPYITQTIQELLPALIEGAILITQALIEALPDIVQTLDVIIPMLADAIIAMLPLLINVGFQIIVQLSQAIANAFPVLVAKMPELVVIIYDALKKLPVLAAEVGLNLVKGLWNGIKSAKDWLLSKIKGFADNVVDSIKGFFGIHSPSRVMRDEVGKNLALGVAEGIRENEKYAEKSAEDLGSTILSAAKEKLEIWQFYNESTLEDEIAFWDEIRKQCVMGTKARLDADKAYYEAKQKLDEENERKAEVAIEAGRKNTKSYNGVKYEAGVDYQSMIDEMKSEGAPEDIIYSLQRKLDAQQAARKFADGGILTKPTIFGYSAAGRPYLGGEAGAEAVAPIDLLKDYVKDAVQEVVGGNNAHYEFNFTSPKAISEKEAARLFKKQMANMQLGY